MSSGLCLFPCRQDLVILHLQGGFCVAFCWFVRGGEAGLWGKGRPGALASSFKKNLYLGKKVLVAQSCLTLCDPMAYSLLGSSVHGILRASILEWVTISFSRRIFPTQGLNPSLLHAGRFFTVWATRETLWFILKWRVIALQCCICFSHTSTWISHRYTSLPFLLNLLPSLLSRRAGCLSLADPLLFQRCLLLLIQ